MELIEPQWNQQIAAAYLLRVIEPADPLLYFAIAQYGYITAAMMMYHEQFPSPYDALHGRKKVVFHRELQDDIELLHTNNYFLLTPEQPYWPSWLFHRFVTYIDQWSTARNAGTGLSNGFNNGLNNGLSNGLSIRRMYRRPMIPPIALWVRTQRAESDSLHSILGPAIALVGTRASSSYGRSISEICVQELAAYNYSIISGGAYGIDAHVHKSAIISHNTTIAVLAGGVDKPTPRSNDTLFAAILENGLLVSEYPPGYFPVKQRFLVRNRIIAGLSNAVVVLEAPLRSGALNTAWWARQIGCPVGAFPGLAYNGNSAGCHELIRENNAILCTNGNEVSQLCFPESTSKSAGLFSVTELNSY